MSLQFADYDADGIQDIVTATWEGMPFLVRGTAEGFAAPRYIRDREEKHIVMTRYYDFGARQYVHESSLNHLISAMLWDWDQDGDLDLIVGGKEGRVYLRKNEGTRSKPAFATQNVQLQAGGAPFQVPGGSTAPKVVDWDGDGLEDLLCGSFAGGVYFYRNTGKAGAPQFAAPTALIAAPTAGSAKPGTSRPETGWYVDPVDLDGDGHLDLVVGARFMNRPKPRKLNAEEKARLKEVTALLKKANAEWSAGYAAIRTATKGDGKAFTKAYQEWNRKPEIRKLSQQRRALTKEQGELKPRARLDSGVWVFRQIRSE